VKGSEGFVLLKSLLTVAVVLVCIAAFLAVLAAAVRQSGHIRYRLEQELVSRNEKTIERLR